MSNETSVFCVDEMPCLNDYVGRLGVRIDSKKVSMIKEWSLPANKNELRSFLSTAVYVQIFCKDFANQSSSLFKTQRRKRKQQTNSTGQAIVQACSIAQKRLCVDSCLGYR